MAFDVTVGGANANSWASVQEFKDYQATRFPAIAWVSGASDSMIQALLIMACRSIGACFDWNGSAVDDVQALPWPRNGMLTRNGFAIPTTVNPVDLKNAQCELAGQMGAGDIVSDNSAAIQGVSSVKAGSVAVSFQSVDTSTSESVDMIIRRMGSEFNYVSSEIPGEVRRLLVPSWFKQPSIMRPVLFSVNGR